MSDPKDSLEMGDIRVIFRSSDDSKEITLVVQSAVPLTEEDFKEILLLYVEDPEFKQVGGEVLDSYDGDLH